MDERNRTEGLHSELFPKDFGDRLECLLELAGLSWEEFAERLGVGHDRVTEWRGGDIPTGREMWHTMPLARSIPGRFEIVLLEAAGSDQGGE